MTSPWMQRALALAESALALTAPNPRVGCVLVDAQDQCIGEGHTQRAGEAHAEVMALRSAAAKGWRTHASRQDGLRGVTAYVTLEPCNHQGRTGPCSQALIAAGVSKVVASVQDPNPLVAGQGFAALRAAGIAVEVGDGATEAVDLNIGFFKRMTQGKPWVRMKIASSLDGQTALTNGQSQWITGTEARNDGHHWRSRACAVLTGIGTVLADNPRLDVRAVAPPRQPTLVIIDSQLETPLNANLFAPTTPERHIWIYAATADATKIAALEQQGAHVTVLPNPNGKVDLDAVLTDLAARQINEVHVEAGFKLNGSLWREGLVDELLLYQAPTLLGVGTGAVNLGPFTHLAQAPRLRYHSITPMGTDLRILARKI